MFDLGIRILVVDDMFAMRKLVTKVCKEIGFKDFTEAGDGAIAWQLIQDAKPPFDLVISDWNMPNSTGLDLLKRVRSDSRFKTLPFLMVTAEAEQSQVAQAIKLGVSNYMIKPFTSEGLRDKLEAIHKKLKSSAAA
jgi:two-component system chemotaxis response regulator CheY